MASEVRSLPHLLVLPRNYRSIVQIALRFISFSANFTVLFLVASAISSSLRVSGDGYSDKEKTLAIVKPDGFLGNYTNTIKEIILDSGFSISIEMITQLNEETVKNFYAEHSAKSFFPRLLKYMTSGPVLVMVLEKVNAIADWRAMIGPTDARKAKVTHPNSIRAMCGLDLERNCVHGSDSSESATREIYFFFKETSPDKLVSDAKSHVELSEI